VRVSSVWLLLMKSWFTDES